MSGNNSPGFDYEFARYDDNSGGSLRSKITSGLYKLSDREGRSKVWAMYANIEDEDGNRLPNIVACKSCFQVFRARRGSTSNLSRHRCFIVNKEDSTEMTRHSRLYNDAADKEKTTKLILTWLTEDCQPLNILEDEYLSKYFKLIGQIGSKCHKSLSIEKILPDRSQISSEITKLHGHYLEKLRTELYSSIYNGFSLSISIWDEENFDFFLMPVVIHFVKNSSVHSRFLGLTRIDKDTIIEDQLVHDQLGDLLSSYEILIDDKVVFVTKDNSILSGFSSNYQIICIKYLLNETLKNCFEKVPAIYGLFENCINLMKYVFEIQPNFDMNFKIEDLESQQDHRSFYQLFDYIEKNWTRINEINNINVVYLSAISSVAKILKFFEDGLKKLQNDKVSTLHLVTVYVHNLKKICNPDPEDTDIVTDLRACLNASLDDLLLPSLTIMHKIALYLFPPAKKLLTLSSSEKMKVKAESVRLIKTYIHPFIDKNSNGFKQNSVKNEKWLNFFDENSDDSSIEDLIIKEMNVYEATQSPFHTNFDILQWWNYHKTDFPYLYELSLWLHSCPATLLTSEKLFKKARNLILDGSFNATTDLNELNQLLFIHFHKHQL